ncbi:3-keto-disaccharide hydrolase [Pseudozobellia thermophila]|uniref:3-keto-alpha-glucoside-1,2-lyase/3-keto-2-hydroxy-glucal hydratase domain-containing protein n=1 Tax=Pseudozobellia thermophila TaxID=192903 RepID=A0A1M6HM82_9FLAO|nr:DUF1080 domain-containing protein [Pseudozobellia thermophila]SHJ23297.1 protein of unknown function [Pseudozobellia thermophila]
MKNTFLGLLCLTFVFLSCAEKKEDFKPLFNGINLEGWEIKNGTAPFTVEDGAIIGTYTSGTPNTFLCTKETYDDFILTFESYLGEETNSGVMFRAQSTPEYRAGRVHGYQMEMDPSPRKWTGGIFDEARRGWIYNLERNPEAKDAFKLNEWNSFRIESIGNSLKVWVNGIQSADVIDDMDASGFIGLQVHSCPERLNGRQVKFKNIQICTTNLEKHRKVSDQKIVQYSYLKNTLTEREQAEGWKLLWDGKTTNGWRGAKLTDFPTEGWSIENGELVVADAGGAESENGGDIVTIEKYGDFELEVDFKITKGANSGIKYFVDTDLNKGKGSSIGCEYQILDDKFHPDAKKGENGNRTLASLYDLIPANAHNFNPYESTPKRVNKYEWNRARIVVNGDDVEHYLNGILVVKYKRGNQQWRDLVASSKYKDWPNFGEVKEGNILLQDHGDKVYFKNIKIKELQ